VYMAIKVVNVQQWGSQKPYQYIWWLQISIYIQITTGDAKIPSLFKKKVSKIKKETKEEGK